MLEISNDLFWSKHTINLPVVGHLLQKLWYLHNLKADQTTDYGVSCP